MRSLGYAAATVLWAIFALVLLAVPVFIVQMFTVVPVGSVDAVTELWRHPDVGDWIGEVVSAIVLPIAVGVVLMVTVGAISNVGLAIILFRRSLRAPEGERLSGSVPVRDAGQYGTTLAISMIPVRRTPVSDVFVRGALAGFSPMLATFVGQSIVGAFTVFTVAWVLWPTRSPVLIVVFAIVSAALGAWGIARYVRAIRRVPLDEPRRARRR